MREHTLDRWACVRKHNPSGHGLKKLAAADEVAQWLKFMYIKYTFYYLISNRCHSV